MMITPHATKEDLDNIADIACWMQGFLAALKLQDEPYLFHDGHIRSLRIAYANMCEEVIKQEHVTKANEHELTDEDIPF